MPDRQLRRLRGRCRLDARPRSDAPGACGSTTTRSCDSHRSGTGVVSLAQRGFFERAQRRHVARRRGADLLLPLGRLRRHHHLLQLPPPRRRRGPQPASPPPAATASRGLHRRHAPHPRRLPLPRRHRSTRPLDSTFKLGFMVLPKVFQPCPSGRWFGFLFFFLLFLAAVTSSLSMLQPPSRSSKKGWASAARPPSRCWASSRSSAPPSPSSALVALDALGLLGRDLRHLRARHDSGDPVRLGAGRGQRGFDELDEGARSACPAWSNTSSSMSRPSSCCSSSGSGRSEAARSGAGSLRLQVRRDERCRSGRADRTGQIIEQYARDRVRRDRGHGRRGGRHHPGF